MLTLPYVLPGAFAAHPTYLDLLNLRSGDTNPQHQYNELYNVLLMASRNADNYCEMGEPNGTLAAHVKTENKRLRTDRDGLLKFHPAHIPALWVSSVAYGTRLTSLTTVNNPNVWIEDGRNIVADLGVSTLFCSGWPQPFALQRLYTQWTYTAGFAHTILGATVSSGATSITVADPTGITGGTSNTPATTMRIWDPGAEETVAVAASYVAGSTTVPLTAPLANNHTVGAGAAATIGVSALPADAHLAIILWATALLIRPASKASSQWRGSAMRLSTSSEEDAYGDASGLVAAAKENLEPYRRIR